MSRFHIGGTLHQSSSPSPVTLSPNGGTPSVRPRSRSTSSSGSRSLQSEVESERAEVLSDVREQQSSQFSKVDSLSQRLEDTNSFAMDAFKRDLPTTVAARQISDVAEEDDNNFGGLGRSDRAAAMGPAIVVSSPTSSLPPYSSASSYGVSGKPLPVEQLLKEAPLPAAATNEELLSPSTDRSFAASSSPASTRPSAISTAAVVVSRAVFPSEERERSSDFLPVRSTVSTSSPTTPPSRTSPLSASTSASPRLSSPRLSSIEPVAVAAGRGGARRNSLNELHGHVTQRVSAMDSMAQQLETHSANSQDLFRRELPTSVAVDERPVDSFPVDRLVSTSTATGSGSGDRMATSDAILISSPSSATLTASTQLPSDAILTHTVTAADSGDSVVALDTASAPTVAITDDATTGTAAPSSVGPISGAGSVSSIQPSISYTTTDFPTKEDDATPEQQIQQLSLALIQSKQAYSELLNRLYSSPTGTSLLGTDTRSVQATPSARLSTVGNDDRSLASFLHDLPVQRGWLVRRRPATANVPAAVTKVYVSLSFDGLLISDNESGENAEKIELARYWLVERAADRATSLAASASSSFSSATASLSAFNVPTSPVAGQSFFRLENGSYVLRLVPIVTSREHPQTVVEPSSSQIIEFMGATDSDLSQPDTLSQWCNAINLRISLLSLLASPNHTNLLAQGGREVLTFLCDVNGSSLLIENKYVHVSELLNYFKEPLLHRRDFSLVLRNVAMDDSGARVLSELLLLNNRIQHVDISHNRVTDIGASYLAMALPSNDGLVGLTVDYNQFTDDGVLELVNAIAASVSLTSLSLRGARLNDRSFAQLVAAMRGGIPRALMKFDVAFNSLTDDSAAAVGDLLRAFGVGALNLSHNAFSEAILPAIDSSLSPDSDSRTMLTVLDLSYNQLSSTAPAALSSLLGTTRSLSVNLSGNALSSSSVVSLLTAGVEVAVDDLRIHRGEEQMAADARPLPLLGRKLSITKQNVIGRVDEIDTLHPTSDKQLGRSLNELSPVEKSNSVRSEESGRLLTTTKQVRGVEKELLDVPSTAACIERTVDGGKTADPRMA